MKKVVYVLFCVIAAACGNTEVKKGRSVGSKIDINTFTKDQILLTNEAYFTGERYLSGASAFILHFRNKDYAVTAKHLLGEWGGVEPEVKLTELAANLEQWKMYPRIPVDSLHDTIIVSADGIDYSKAQGDILMLKIVNKDYTIKALKPFTHPPSSDEKFYLIGCPYSEGDCKQNVYELEYNSSNPFEAKFTFVIKGNFELPGFSGAPVINEEGQVVGVLVRGGESGGRYLVEVTSITELLKIN